MTFRQASLEEVPQWLNGPQTQGQVGALADALDGEIADLQAAIVQRFATLCDDFALDVVGGQYKLERFPGESFATYRARLLEAWDTWAAAGTRAGIIGSLNAFGIPDVEVYGNRV